MKLWQVVVLCLAVGGLVWMCGDVWAQSTARSDLLSNGSVGCTLARNLYISTQSLIAGNVGLLIGLLMLLAGFWALINGAALIPSMATIIMGGMITALPTLINTFFEGVGGLMAAGGSNGMGGVEFNPDPDCVAQETEICDTFPGVGRVCTPMYKYNGHYYGIVQ